MKPILILLLSIVTLSLARATELKSFNVGKNEGKVFQENIEFNVFPLLEGKQKIGRLFSIGGLPRPIKKKSKSFNEERFLLLIYDAGSAGTSRQTQMDRLAVFHLPKGESPRQTLDVPIHLRIYLGSDMQDSYQRSIDWNPKNKELKLGEMDQFDSILYKWASGRWVEKG